METQPINRESLDHARTLLAIAARLLVDAVADAPLTPAQVEAHRRAVNLTSAAAVAVDDVLASLAAEP
jgi:hypothetical protein